MSQTNYLLVILILLVGSSFIYEYVNRKTAPSPSSPSSQLHSVTSAVGVPKYSTNCGVDDACSGGGGICFIDRCFCKNGASGSFCEIGKPRNCEQIPVLAEKLTCYQHPDYGSAFVDYATWQRAVQEEANYWGRTTSNDDRSIEHIEGFSAFQAIPHAADLGDYSEFGCGPYSQTLTALHPVREDLKFSSILLADPNMHNYLKNVKNVKYAEGITVPNVTTYLVAAGAEARLFHERFDTLLMTNVLEHVQSSYAVLENVWLSLKPGGMLIFHDRCWPADLNFAEGELQDIIYHPIRLGRPILDAFLSHFDPIYENWEGTAAMKERGNVGVYFIGTKRLPGGKGRG